MKNGSVILRLGMGRDERIVTLSDNPAITQLDLSLFVSGKQASECGKREVFNILLSINTKRKEFYIPTI